MLNLLYMNKEAIYRMERVRIFFTKKYGRPAYEFVKPRYAFVGEYSVGIENTYRSINPEFRNIPIKEAFWNLNEDLNLTCFFHYKDGQWRVISYFFLASRR